MLFCSSEKEPSEGISISQQSAMRCHAMHKPAMRTQNQTLDWSWYPEALPAQKHAVDMKRTCTTLKNLPPAYEAVKTGASPLCDTTARAEIKMACMRHAFQTEPGSRPLFVA